jgi:hypothetical protein
MLDNAVVDISPLWVSCSLFNESRAIPNRVNGDIKLVAPSPVTRIANFGHAPLKWMD